MRFDRGSASVFRVHRIRSNWYSLPSSDESAVRTTALFHMLAGQPAIFGNARANALSDRYVGTCTMPSASGSRPRRNGAVHRASASYTCPMRSKIPGSASCTQYGGSPWPFTPSSQRETVCCPTGLGSDGSFGTSRPRITPRSA